MAKVTPDNLANEIVKMFKDYTGEVVEAIGDAADKISKDVLAEVKERAPKQTGEYAHGFRRQSIKVKSGLIYTVWNPKHYRRVHLLEKGHAKKGGGRVEGKPHMGPAELTHTERYERRVEQIIKEGGK